MSTLAEIARRAMLDRGMLPDFSEEEEREAEALSNPAQPPPSSTLRDLRASLWISIDNDDSLDLDQLTYAENRTIYVAIADVETLVKEGSALDKHASINTTSVYTPTVVFPMLPPKLSTNLTSLNQEEDRLAVVAEIEVAEDGTYEPRAIYPALVKNRAKLAYSQVGAFLESKKSDALPKVEGLVEQILLQDRLAQRMKENRYRQGALSFGTIEVQPVIENGAVVGLKESVHNRANGLIENFMMAANVAITRTLIDLKLPTLKRIVRDPLRWDRIVALAKERGTILPPQPDAKALRTFLLKQREADPLRFPDLSLAMIKLIGRGEYIVALPGVPTPGHFDLALLDYAHTTAPNRRYPDLIMQRLLKSYFYGRQPAYSIEELTALAAHCTEKEDDATKVERRVRKSAAAMVLTPQVGQTFEGLITGSSEKGTWVRLFKPPVEGRLVRGFEGVDVGERVTVKLIHVDVQQGHIDFVRV